MEGRDVVLVDLEFDTGTRGGALLGDIASSLVSVDELLRDLASLTADSSTAEFRNVEIVAIEMRSPLRVRLSLYGISAEAVEAFQQMCRHVILARGFQVPDTIAARITEVEARRLQGHVTALQNAAIPLKRVEVLA